MRVFVSYRRADVGGYAGRLSDALVSRLGPDNVFFDVATIPAGRDYSAEIDSALAASDATLAVVGPGWLTAGAPDGTRRLDQPGDVVRRELARALAANIPVVPVLLGGATLPSEDQLPGELAELALRQAFVIRDDSFHRDVDGLLNSLRGKRTAPVGRRRRWLVGAVAAALLALLVGTLWFVTRPTSNSDGATSGDLTGCPTPGSTWTSVKLAGKPSPRIKDTDGSVVIQVNAARWRPYGPGTWQIVLNTAMENHNSIDRQHGPWYYRDFQVAQRAFDATCFDTPRETYPAPGEIADGHVGFEVSCKPTGAMDLVFNSPVDNSRTRLRITTASRPSDCVS
ncbi:MAG: toll/interleukin-1 receptor domain-containing protein [Actinomycetes bacterium]